MNELQRDNLRHFISLLGLQKVIIILFSFTSKGVQNFLTGFSSLVNAYFSLSTDSCWQTVCHVCFFAMWTAPPVPQGCFFIDRNTTYVTLKWSSTSSAYAYIITYSVGKESRTSSTNQTVITLSDLVPGSLYTFFLTAQGDGGRSNQTSCTTSTGN